ncbi:MAG: SprT-like domain-containing protein [Duncaniella sp.]|nr:SprT-like domain-containing protein [Duncaniella sp.]
MPLSVDYISARHSLWLSRIAGAGVWNVAGMDRVNFEVRPQARSLNGKFIRRVTLSRNPLRRHVVSDTIVIYDNPWLDSELKVDSVIVHEMIHQYIAVARLRDTSSHGRLFRSFMTALNRRFAGQLELHVSTRSSIPATAATERRSSSPHILAVVTDADHFFCCRVMRSAVRSLHTLLRRLLSGRQIAGYGWYISSDPYFDGVRACRTRLHGLRHPLGELQAFITTHNLSALPSDKLKSLQSK